MNIAKLKTALQRRYDAGRKTGGDRMNLDALEYIEQLEAELAALKQAIQAEPELPGDMPDAMWCALNDDRDAMNEAFRIVVRQTKEGILERAKLSKENKHE